MAIVVVVAALALARDHLGFRDSGSQRTSFPTLITCREGTAVCTPGRSAGGQQFKLLRVAESKQNASVVGVGADTGGDGPATVRICTRSGGTIVCGLQPAAGEKAFALYLRG